MAATGLAFQLVIRDETDTFDEFVVTSLPPAGDPENEHNYLTEPPSVDGSSADLLAGTTDVGSGTIKFWDELSTVANRLLAVEDFESYIGGSFTGGEDGAPNALIRAGRWSREGITDLTGQVSAGGDAFDGTQCYAVGWDPAVPVTGDSYIRRSDWSDQSLPADTDVTVRARAKPSTWIGTGGDTPPAVGMRVTGADAAAESTYASSTPVVWHGLVVPNRSRSDATLDVDLGHFGFVNGGGIRDALWDRVEIWSAEEGRVMTGGLYQLVDDVPRIAHLSRRARIDQTTNGGTDWTTFHRGYLNRLECDGGEWTVTVGDTTRQEQQTELFATLPTLTPASLGLPIPMPRVGLILGGPIAADATYGTFAGIADRGPTRWKVEAVYTDPGGEFRTVRLKFLSGYLRPWYHASRARFDEDEWVQMNVLGRPYFQWDPVSYQSVISATVNHFGYFPDLRARLDPVGAGDVVEKMPLARLVKHEPGDKEAPKAEYDALVGNDSVIYVDWTNDAVAAPFPDVDDEFDVTMYSAVISDKNPLLLAGHPVDLLAYAASLSGIPWNAASRTSAKAALGAGLWYEWKVTGVMKFADAQKQLGGFFGFLFRPDLTTGERHFIPTRVRPAAPEFSITNADRVGGEGAETSLPAVWAAEEDSVVNIVTFTTTRFRFFRFKEDSGDPPVTMLAEAKAEVEGHRGDTTVNGERTIRYELSGQLQRRAADGTVTPLILATQDPANPGYAEDAGGVIVDYAGWGVAETVVVVDAERDAASAQVGMEGVIDLPDLPVPRVGASPLTQRGLGPRVVRVKKRDPQIGQVQFTLVHAGELSQDAVASPASGGSADPGTPELPTLLLAASSTAPTTAVTVTLTNGADLGADNLRTELEYLVQAGTPAGSDEGEDFGPVTAYPDGDSTTIDTPSVAPGSVVWVRARSVNVTTGVASAWTAWTSYTLDPIENGGGGPGETPYAPTLSASAVVDPTTGDVTATANASASAVSVKFAIGPVGGAPPSLGDVRAATADSSAPFASGTLATLTAGQVRTVGALAYDAVGNESAMATAPAARLAAAALDLRHTLVFVFDGGGAALAADMAADAVVDFAHEIEAATVLLDQAGDVAIDVRRDSYANYPPTGGDSIVASAPPTVTAASKSRDATLAGWSTAGAAGDTYRATLTSAATAERATLALTLRRL